MELAPAVCALALERALALARVFFPDPFFALSFVFSAALAREPLDLRATAGAASFDVELASAHSAGTGICTFACTTSNKKPRGRASARGTYFMTEEFQQPISIRSLFFVLQFIQLQQRFCVLNLHHDHHS